MLSDEVYESLNGNGNKVTIDMRKREDKVNLSPPQKCFRNIKNASCSSWFFVPAHLSTSVRRHEGVALVTCINVVTEFYRIPENQNDGGSDVTNLK